MYLFHKTIPKKDIGGGILMQELGPGDRMNVLHWNMADGSVIPMHAHPHEQFGYVIRGGFKMRIDGRDATLSEGDSYFVPPNAPHTFTAIGDTEAIDVFNPIKHDIPGRK
jgi:quercetin dioxygenase-like cupin family protein